MISNQNLIKILISKEIFNKLANILLRKNPLLLRQKMLNSDGRTDRQTDRQTGGDHAEATSPFSYFC